MIYEQLYSDFKKLFPENITLLDKFADDANADENDGMHIMFSFVVVPFVLNLLNNGSSDELKVAFDFFEKMAVSDSRDITEVLEFTVIENLMSNGKKLYENAKKYMGTETIICCKRVEKYLNVGK